MKKIISLVLVMVMVLALAACNPATPTEPINKPTKPTTAPTEPTAKPTEPTEPTEPAEGVMSHAEFVAAEDGTVVTVEFYVQANQSWWNDQICLYGQTPEGGYFAYNAGCSQEDAAKITAGTKVRVTGEKTTYQGLVEIMYGTVEVLTDAQPWVAEATDVTALLGQEAMAEHMNKFVAFKGMTVVAIEYKNGEPGDDIYVTLSKDGAEYSFCVERYLTGPSSALYQAVQALSLGDIVDVEGFLYWYEGPNTHITGVTVK